MIQFSFPKAGYLKHAHEINTAIETVLQDDLYIKGKNLKAFELNFSSYIGATYGVGVGNGTDAIYLALSSLGVGVGDEVLTVSHTATGTLVGITRTGAVPVFVDIDKATYNIDHTKLEEKISKKTKALVIVHLYGQACDMDPIMHISQKHSIPIIEDCAQSAGAEYNDQKVGSFGIASCFSFFPTKNLACIGDGGMVLTKSEEIHDQVMSMREYGWDENRDARILGINSRLDEIQAAILNVKLLHLDEDNNERRKIAAEYRKRINNDTLISPKVIKKCRHVYHLYVVAVRQNREGFVNFLKNEGINPGIHYPNPVHQQTFYKKYSHDNHLPNTEEVASTVVSIPLYQGLRAEDLEHCIQTINKFDPSR